MQVHVPLLKLCNKANVVIVRGQESYHHDFQLELKFNLNSHVREASFYLSFSSLCSLAKKYRL